MTNRRSERQAAARIKVLDAFLADPLRPRYQYDLWRETGVRSGILYPLLWHWTVNGWLTQTVEKAGRRPRACYQLTQLGQAAARAEVNNAAD